MDRDEQAIRRIARAGKTGKVKRAYKRKYGKKRGCLDIFLVAFTAILLIVIVFGI